MLKNKKLFLGIAIIATTTLAAIGYFAVTPAVQVSLYKSSVNGSQSKVNEAFNELAEFQNKESFTKSDAEGAVMRADAKAGQDALKDLEAALANHGTKLQAFNELPLLSWNNSYKLASELKKDQAEYITTLQEYQAEMKAILAYVEKTADATDKLAETEPLVASLEQAVSIEEMNSKMDAILKKFDEAIAITEQSQAPKSLKEMHSFAMGANKEIRKLFGDMANAIKAEDFDKLSTAYGQLGTKASEATTEYNQLAAKFTRESKLTKLSDRLKELQRSIDSKIAQLG